MGLQFFTMHTIESRIPGYREGGAAGNEIQDADILHTQHI
jgi:hypothetical protein